MASVKQTAEDTAQNDDCDNLSLNSTEASEGNEDGLYNVERILCEEQSDDGGMWYLIQWEGYPQERSTWEPEINIEEERTLRDWSEEKLRIALGHAKPFDINSWQAQVKKLEQAKVDRRKLRCERRKGLEFSMSSSESETAEPTQLNLPRDYVSGNEVKVGFENPGDILGDRPIPSRRRQSRATPKPILTDDECDEDSDAELIPSTRLPRRERTNEAKAGIGNLSEKALIEDQKSKESEQDQEKTEKVKARNEKRPEKKEKAHNSTNPANASHQRLSSREPSPCEPFHGFVESNTKPRTEAPSRTGSIGSANRQSVSRSAAQISRGGSGAKRGGHEDSRPSFTATAPLIHKRSSVKAALGDKKRNELFKTISTRRRAELAGRAIADLVPDPGLLTLVNPAEHRAFSKIPKKAHPVSGGARETPDSATFRNKNMVTFKHQELSSLCDELGVSAEAGIPRDQNAKDMADLEEQERKLKEEIHGLRSDVLRIRPQSNTSFIPEVSKADSYNYSTSFLTVRSFSDSNNTDINQNPNMIRNATATCQRLDPLPKPVVKVSYREYKRRKMSDFSSGLPVGATFGRNVSQRISLVFSGIDTKSHESWIQELQGLIDIRFDVSCLSSDLERNAKISGNRMAIGNVTTDCVGTALLNKVANGLRPLFCTVSIHKNFVIVLFPAKCEEWKFLETSHEPGGDSNLRYLIFQPSVDINSRVYESVADLPSTSVDLIQSQLESLIDPKQRFDHRALRHGPHNQTKPAYYFLLFPPMFAATAEFFRSWLHEYNPANKIFTSEKAGSWHTFIDQATEGGVVLIHQTLLPAVSQIPMLFSTLNNTTSLRFRCVSDTSFTSSFSKPLVAHEAFPVVTAVSCLFPHGGAILLTPSFLITDPERTFELLRFIDQKTKNSSLESWKLVTCYNLRRYLHDLAIETAEKSKELYRSFPADKMNEDKDEIAKGMGLAHKDCEIKFANYMLLDSIMTRERMAGYPYSWNEENPDEFKCPIIYADEDIGQNDEKRLVEWFAGWTMSRLDIFRIFIVVGTKSPEPQATIPPPRVKLTAIVDNSAGETANRCSTAAQQPNSQATTATDTYLISKIVKSSSPVLQPESVQSSALQFSSQSAALGTEIPISEGLGNSHKRSRSKKVSWSCDLIEDSSQLQSQNCSDQPTIDNQSPTVKLNQINTISIMQKSFEPLLLNTSEPDSCGATSSIHITNIGMFMTIGELEGTFGAYGPISSARVVSEANVPELQGFVNFEHINSAITARASLQNKKTFSGVGPLKIKFATSRDPPGQPNLGPSATKIPLVMKTHFSSTPPLLLTSLPVPQDATSEIHIQDIHPLTTIRKIKEVFGAYGPISSARIVSIKSGGLQGFVKFEHLNSAINAKESLQDKEILQGVEPTKLNFAIPCLKDNPGSDMNNVPIPPQEQPSRPRLLFPNEPKPFDASSSLYLGDIPESYGECELKKIFERFGPIMSIRSMPLKNTDGRRRNGFINFQFTNSAINAKNMLSKKELFVNGGQSTIGFAKTFGYKSPPGSPQMYAIPGNNFLDSRASDSGKVYMNSPKNQDAIYSPSDRIWMLDDSNENSRRQPLPNRTQDTRMVPEDLQPTFREEMNKDNNTGIGINGEKVCLQNNQFRKSTHGIDKNANENALIFVGLSGSDLATAERYLEEHNGNIEEAFQHYLRVTQVSNLDVVPQQGNRFIDHLVHEDVQRAMQLLRSETQSRQDHGPPNLDGLDERGARSTKILTTPSGILMNGEISRRYVPSSRRPGSGSVRPEIDIRPGFTPSEDKLVYKNTRVVGGVPQFEIGDVSGFGNKPRKGHLDHSPADDCPNARNTYDVFKFDEPTLSWYDKSKQDGRGWEHILVTDGENTMKALGIEPIKE